MFALGIILAWWYKAISCGWSAAVGSIPIVAMIPKFNMFADEGNDSSCRHFNKMIYGGSAASVGRRTTVPVVKKEEDHAAGTPFS